MRDEELPKFAVGHLRTHQCVLRRGNLILFLYGEREQSVLFIILVDLKVQKKMQPHGPKTERDVVIDLVNKGHTQTSVAALLDRSRKFVYETIRRFEETGSTCDRPRSGRPPKLTPAITLELKSKVQGQSHQSLERIKGDLSRDYGISVATAAISAALHRVGLHSGTRQRAPKITPKQAKDRVAWCNKHLHGDFSDWVWLDEKQFLFGRISNPHNDRVWVEKGQEVPPAEEEAYPASCRVLAGVCSKGLVGPFEYEGNLNSEAYQALLRDHVIPAVDAMFKNKPWVLVHDRASCHTSASTAAMLEEEGIEHMHLPAKSPDLNPVDNLFGIAAENLDKMNPPDASEFADYVAQSFASVPESALTNMVESYTKRLRRIINHKGLYTRTK